MGREQQCRFTYGFFFFLMWQSSVATTFVCRELERSQMGNTADACSLDPLATKFKAFQFDCYEIEDGHDELEILKTINKTSNSKKPVAIICNTIKGKGISFMEGKTLWHYRPPKGEDFDNAIKELGEF